jgi:hypothetical protein
MSRYVVAVVKRDVAEAPGAIGILGHQGDNRVVSSCCDPAGYEATFGERFARRMARRYRKRGLDGTQQRMLAFLTERGIDGATVLEIGGGVGELQVELLRRGGASATNLEISTHYEEEARRLLDEAGLEGRATRRHLDIATAPDDVEVHDVVVLHRVVCCYADYERLLAAAGSHARRLLVFSYPPRNLLTRIALGLDTLAQRVRRNDFRAYVHPPPAMVAVLGAQGLEPRFHHHGTVWDVVGFER